MKSEVDIREENEDNIREGEKKTLMINTGGWNSWPANFFYNNNTKI